MRKITLISLFMLLFTQTPAWAEVVVIVRQQAEATGNYVRICDIARVEGPKELALEVSKTILGPTPPRGQVVEITRWEIEHRIYEMGLHTQVSFTGNDVVRVSGNGVPSSRGQDAFADEGTPGYVKPFMAEQLVKEDRSRLARDTSPATVRKNPEMPGPRDVADSLPQMGEMPTAAARPRNPLALTSETAKERVANAAANYIAARYRRPDVEVEAKVLSVNAVVPDDAREIVVEEALDGRVPGRAVLAVKVVDFDGKRLNPIEVSIDSEVYALAPVAAKPLYKGDVLNPRDVLVTRVKMKSGLSYLPPDRKAVEGREMQKHVSPGTPILATDATPTAAVKRGTLVVVEAQGKGWKMQASAKALGTGNLGDLIYVEDVSSKAKYQARVTGQGTVTALPKAKNEL